MRRLERLGIIGAGAIASLLMETLARRLPHPLDRLDILTTPRGAGKARGLVAAHGARIARVAEVHTGLAALLAKRPELIAECASHEALRAHGALALQAGADVACVSIGALTDDALMAELSAAADSSGAQLILCPGALGGVDILAAAGLSGIESLTYRSLKPPEAWRGTKAEAAVNLSALAAPETFFKGGAREAARDFPKNANVAAMAALAGPGFDRTRVEMIADPGVSANIHEIELDSAAARVSIRIEGRSLPANPKTSASTAYALARIVLNRVRAVVI